MKSEITTNRFRLLLLLIKEKKLWYLASVLTLGLASFLMFMVPYIVQALIDRVITEPPVEEPGIAQSMISLLGGREYLANHLWIVLILVVLVTAISGLFMFIKDFLAARASELTLKVLRDRVYQHLHHLPNAFHSKADSGDLLQRCTSDMDLLKEFLNVQVMNMGQTFMLLLIVIPIMLTQSVQMTVVALCIVPLVLFGGYIYFRYISDFFKKVEEAEGEMITVVQENLTGIRVVRAFARQDYESQKFEHKNSRYRTLMYQMICRDAWYFGCLDFLCMFQTGTVLIVGGWMAGQGHITLGVYFAFILYTGIVIWPTQRLGKDLSESAKAMVALGRIQDILDQPVENQTEETVDLAQRLTGQIEFRDVSFSYEQDNPVLKNLSFQIDSGETIAIVGPTGAGKSTMIKLLLRLYDHQEGRILVDGIDISRVERKQLRQQIGTLLQEPFLFSRSLKENIKFGRPTSSDEEMVGSTQAAQVHQTIKTFDDGYDTVIGERGVNLSGGQCQRVALSRTLLKDPPIMLLDDTLSAVDSITEKKIIDALHHKKGEQTLLIITHRISVCQHADRIFVMNHGALVQQGSHQELMTCSGFYRQLWQIQTGQEQNFLDDLELKATTSV